LPSRLNFFNSPPAPVNPDSEPAINGHGHGKVSSAKLERTFSDAVIYFYFNAILRFSAKIAPMQKVDLCWFQIYFKVIQDLRTQRHVLCLQFLLPSSLVQKLSGKVNFSLLSNPCIFEPKLSNCYHWGNLTTEPLLI
jgi:hypothetical protein